MDLEAVMDEVAGVLETITGLRVQPLPPLKVTPPAGYVGYPESIGFDETYGRGTDSLQGLPIVALVGLATDRAARKAVSAWSAGAGSNSVKARMEAHAWTSCDDLTVTRCEFDVIEVAGTKYLAAIFMADALGPGTT